MIRLGVDVNQANNNVGVTPLFIASLNGHLKIVKVLIASGGLVNKAINDNTTPVHIASHQGHT